MKLYSEAVNIITEKYTVLDFIDLVEFLNPEDLAKKLVQHVSHSFLPNERLIILHHDTDYYESLESTGYYIYNFFRLCANYDISLNHVLFITNHYGIKSEIKNVEKQICNSSSITVVYTSQWYDFPKWEDIENAKEQHNTQEISMLYSCLNGQARMHRLFVLSLLKEKNLLDKGLVSYHFKS